SQTPCKTLFFVSWTLSDIIATTARKITYTPTSTPLQGRQKKSTSLATGIVAILSLVGQCDRPCPPFRRCSKSLPSFIGDLADLLPSPDSNGLLATSCQA